ncbi:MAG: hypothetical protein JJ863_00010 [Deltaproteobacteria bacterium]|nr:hypothetical protein [Deltaproteobacteria bacterium]
MSVSLIPVVEFEPARFATMERTPPTSGEEWARYWQAALQDAGIVGLTPYAPGSWFVPVESLADPLAIRGLLDLALVDARELGVDAIGPLNGGYVLEVGRFAVEPQCCGDLANLEEWRIAASIESRDWQPVWIGHPQTYVRAEADTLSFVEPSDEPPRPDTPTVSVGRDSLHAAIRLAEELIEAFAMRLRPEVDALALGLSTGDVLDVLVGRA